MKMLLRLYQKKNTTLEIIADRNWRLGGVGLFLIEVYAGRSYSSLEQVSTCRQTNRQTQRRRDTKTRQETQCGDIYKHLTTLTDNQLKL